MVGYSGLDPMEDTETVTIMWKPRGRTCYSGLDPMEDTETDLDDGDAGALALELQWARSDGGY